MEKRINILAGMPVMKAIIKLSLPVVMGMIVQVLYNLVDVWFIGMLGDANQLAAANVSTPIFVIFLSITAIIGTGGAAHISRCLGAKRMLRAQRTLSISVVFCIIIAIISAFLGIVYIKPLINFLGADFERLAAVHEFARQYTLVLLYGAVIIMTNYTLSQILRAEGATHHSTIGMIIGVVANILLDPLFIFVFDMGVQGAAIATVLGNLLGLIYYLCIYFSGHTIVRMRFSVFKFDKSTIYQIFKIGLPAAMGQFLLTISMVFNSNVAAGYGVLEVSAMGIAFKISLVGLFVFIGISAGCQPISGYSYGAKNAERLREVVRRGSELTLVIGTALFIIFFAIARETMAVFTYDQSIISIGTKILRAQIASWLLVGPELVILTTLQSIGKSRAALVLAVSRQGVLYIPLALLLKSMFGFIGFVWAQALCDAVMVVVSVYLMKIVLDKYAVRV